MKTGGAARSLIVRTSPVARIIKVEIRRYVVLDDPRGPSETFYEPTTRNQRTRRQWALDAFSRLFRKGGVKSWKTLSSRIRDNDNVKIIIVSFLFDCNVQLIDIGCTIRCHDDACWVSGSQRCRHNVKSPFAWDKPAPDFENISQWPRADWRRIKRCSHFGASTTRTPKPSAFPQKG